MMYRMQLLLFLFYAPIFAGVTSSIPNVGNFSSGEERSDDDKVSDVSSNEEDSEGSSSCITHCSEEIEQYPLLQDFLSDHGKGKTHNQFQALKQIFYLNSDSQTIRHHVVYLLKQLPGLVKNSKDFQDFSSFIPMIENPPSYPIFLYKQLHARYKKQWQRYIKEKEALESLVFETEEDKKSKEKAIDLLQAEARKSFALLENLSAVKSGQNIMNKRYHIYTIYKKEMQEEQRNHQLKYVHRGTQALLNKKKQLSMDEYCYSIALYYLYYYPTISLAYYYFLQETIKMFLIQQTL